MLIRRTLQVGLAALGVAALLTFAWNIALGVGLPTVGQVIASYLTWGRWANVAMLVVYAALLIVAPLLPDARRSGHVMLAGAAIAGVGKLLEFPTFEVADLAPISAIPIDLTAGRLTDLSTLASPTFTWAGGTILLAIGLFILAVDAEDRRWRRASTTLGAALVLSALTHVNAFGLVGVHWFASWISIGLLGFWLLVALRMASTPEYLRSSSYLRDRSTAGGR